MSIIKKNRERLGTTEGNNHANIIQILRSNIEGEVEGECEEEGIDFTELNGF